MKNGHIKIHVIIGVMLAIFSMIGCSYAFTYDVSSGIKEKVSALSERLARVEATIEIFAETRETMEEFNRNIEVIEVILLDYKLNK